MVDPLEQIKATFFQECQELLGDLETGLMALEAGEGDADTINAVFRAVHSVKGGAGAFGMEALVRFAHVFETTLDEARAGRLAADEPLIKLMLRASDMLADHLSEAQGGAPADAAVSATLQAELEAYTHGGPSAAPSAELGAAPVAASLEPEPDEWGFVPLTVQIDAPAFAPLEAAPAGWRVEFAPFAALYANANDVPPLIRELERLGPCAVRLDADALPTLEGLDPESACLSWTIEVSAACERDQVLEAFEFVDGDCRLTVEPLGSPEPSFDIDALLAAARTPELADETPPPPPDIETMLAAARAPEPAMPEGAVQAVIDQVMAPVPVKPEAAAPVRPANDAAAREPSAAQATIRVDLERVDRLIDLVGELVINQAMLAQRVAESGVGRSSGVAMGLDELEQLTREIQDSVMAIRAQPVKSVFSRMPRLVRECAAMTGKSVRLVTEGEGTEVDKTVIERLSDPITHMIRNAIDHGLESPEARRAAGKPEEGVVRLAALHRSGRIVIEVSDDGKGIDRARVRQIAVDKGLIDPEAVLTDEETDNIIFMPGFSTASAVSDLSGRGVGMDVVKRSIQGLGGRISISSAPGEGSKFTLSLPLTLAVLDGMVVTVGDQTLVAPLTSIVETLQPKPAAVRTLGPQSRVIAVRDSYVPLIDVGAVLGWRDEAADPCAGVCLLVESEGAGRAALLVDAIQGQRQVVIKSLEANYQHVPGIAAATILGDGRVALILDVDAAVALRGRPAAAPVPAAAAPAPLLALAS